MRNLLICALLAAVGCEAEPLEASDAAPAPDAAADTDPEPPLDAAPADDLGPDPDAVTDMAPAVDQGPPDAAPAVDGALDPDAEAGDLGPNDAAVDAAVDAARDAEPLPDGGVDLDWIEVACDDPGWTPGMCIAGEGRRQESAGAGHIAEEIVIEYAETPPASGDHRSRWGRWGEYSYMPPQRYLHNLEHGGIALLYHPCAEAEAVDALRELARAWPEDDTGAFRWVMTPYPELPTAIAVVAWEWVYSAECVRPDEIGGFIERYYRMAPEDVRSDGAYERGWLGR